MAKLQNATRIFGSATIDTFLFVNGNIASNSTNSGSLQVQGGVGISGGLYVGGSSTFTNAITVNAGTSIFNNLQVNGYNYTAGTNKPALLMNQPSGGGNYGAIGNYTTNESDTNTFGLGWTGATTSWSYNIFPALTWNEVGVVVITTGTSASSTNTGAFQVVGGAGIGGNLYVGSSATIGVAVTNAVVPAVYSNNSLYSSYTSPTISTASAQNLDTYSTSTFRTAKYVVQIYDNGKVHVEEFMLFHDNAIAYLTEYAVATNTGELGSFDANISSGIMTVTFTPNYTPTAMTIKVVRTAITA